ncbi:Galactose oxidase/kelch repeat superfamily protein [Prunus dulcis]|uniref:Galactose oxidase/kelch repeat superfamily protein n=1 Tax=Prunus dulcis TaxID=3755 RepID=A0A4Y1RUQ3_PRUDU|nr:Galactose oxidase/kelch repeat superfamily protein [Prunus dulcis]
MGGWDPASYQPVRDVFVYEFTTQRWTRERYAGDPVVLSPPASSTAGSTSRRPRPEQERVEIGEVYDVRENEWTELPGMSQERDECEGFVSGSEFWVVSGYGTDSQGGFVGCAEVYEIGSGQWRRVEDAWRQVSARGLALGLEGWEAVLLGRL